MELLCRSFTRTVFAGTSLFMCASLWLLMDSQILFCMEVGANVTPPSSVSFFFSVLPRAFKFCDFNFKIWGTLLVVQDLYFPLYLTLLSQSDAIFRSLNIQLLNNILLLRFKKPNYRVFLIKNASNWYWLM